MPLNSKILTNNQEPVATSIIAPVNSGTLISSSKEHTVTLIDLFLGFLESIANFFSDFFKSKNQAPETAAPALDKREIAPLPISAHKTVPLEAKKPMGKIVPSQAIKGHAPVGIRNGGANCWVNSMLQMLAKAPRIAKRILERANGNCKEIAPLLLEYYDSQIANRPISNIDSQVFRRWFNNSALVSSDISSHIDLSEAILILFKEIGYNYPLYETEHFSQGERIEELGDGSIIWLDLSDGIRSFRQLFLNFFSSPTANGYQVKKFETVPEDLIIELKKLPHDEITEIPMNLEFPLEATIGNEANIRYEFVSCIIHSGGSEHGHYFTIQKEGNDYYLINDSDVNKISHNTAMNYLRHGKLFHYKKADAAPLSIQQFAQPAIPTGSSMKSPEIAAAGTTDAQPTESNSLTPILYFTALTIVGIAAYSFL